MSNLTVMQARAIARERERDLAARLAARDRGRTIPDPPAGWWAALRDRIARPGHPLRPLA